MRENEGVFCPNERRRIYLAFFFFMEKETAALRKSLTAQKEKVRGKGERKKQNAFVSPLKVAKNRIKKYF